MMIGLLVVLALLGHLLVGFLTSVVYVRWDERRYHRRHGQWRTSTWHREEPIVVCLATGYLAPIGALVIAFCIWWGDHVDGGSLTDWFYSPVAKRKDTFRDL